MAALEVMLTFCGVLIAIFVLLGLCSVMHKKNRQKEANNADSMTTAEQLLIHRASLTMNSGMVLHSGGMDACDGMDCMV